MVKAKKDVNNYHVVLHPSKELQDSIELIRNHQMIAPSKVATYAKLVELGITKYWELQDEIRSPLNSVAQSSNNSKS